MTQRFLSLVYSHRNARVHIRGKGIFKDIQSIHCGSHKGERMQPTKTLENKTVVVDSYDRKSNNNTKE